MRPIYKISQWDEEGLWDEHPIGTLFENVYLSGTLDGELYPTDFTLLDLYNHYVTMLNETQYIYCGENAPTSPNVQIWYEYEYTDETTEEEPSVE